MDEQHPRPAARAAITRAQNEALAAISEAISKMRALRSLTASRELSVAITEAETAELWLSAGVVRERHT